MYISAIQNRPASTSKRMQSSTVSHSDSISKRNESDNYVNRGNNNIAFGGILDSVKKIITPGVVIGAVVGYAATGVTWSVCGIVTAITGGASAPLTLPILGTGASIGAKVGRKIEKFIDGK